MSLDSEATVKRVLVVNADDFGRSAGINEGIIAAHERGIVTSASLMVRWPDAGDAAVYAGSHRELSVGLHVDIAEWVSRDGAWEAVYQIVADGDHDAVAAEVNRQLTLFEALVHRPPTHLDSHQHAHKSEPLREVLRDAARQLGVPIRHYARDIAYCGDFHGQSGSGEPYPEGVTVDALLKIVRNLSPGVTELACHPGFGDDSESAYSSERGDEVRALCDPRVRASIETEGIQLVSFEGIPSTDLSDRKGETAERIRNV